MALGNDRPMWFPALLHTSWTKKGCVKYLDWTSLLLYTKLGVFNSYPTRSGACWFSVVTLRGPEPAGFLFYLVFCSGACWFSVLPDFLFRSLLVLCSTWFSVPEPAGFLFYLVFCSGACWFSVLPGFLFRSLLVFCSTWSLIAHTWCPRSKSVSD
jgi:hypothetical protein